MARRRRTRHAPRRFTNTAAAPPAPAERPGRPPAPVAPAKRDRGYRIDNLVTSDGGATTVSVWIYAEIGDWGVTAADFVAELQGITASNIDLHLNSPGGDVFDGLAIYNALRTHPANVTSYIDGVAASAASFIACAGNTVKIARNAQIMIHEASGICFGNAGDMTEMAAVLDRFSDNIADIYAQKAGGTVKAWRKSMQAETWYSSAEAVAAGLADEVDVVEPDRAAAEFDLSVFAYAGRAKAPAPELAAHADPTPVPVPDPAPAPDPEPAPEPEPEPELPVFDPAVLLTALTAAYDPEPPMPGFDPDYFRTVMANVATSAAAPPDPKITDPAPAGPEFPPIDPSIFERALKEARL